MTARHDVPLAQSAAAEITGAACRDRGAWWSRREAEHERASTKEAAAAAARPALRLCRRCPAAAYELCEIWAQLDEYTGLAAGAAYLNGRRLDPARVRQLPTPPQTAA